MLTTEIASKIDEINMQDVPYHVWHLFGIKTKVIHIVGSDQISLGEDYANLDEIKKALEWYAEQFKGTIKWG